ncbi:fructosamine kinase family protein [Isoptericola cucumis]|uniref:Fructosamine kinase n=1 Tax=Isoptericola cucumis TaxID=1776856 RepID=A0ABQ2B6X0_9MICO|nr:fructosamine kinase family protein [Isoptericola cucumis]GGI06914.1 fructosamine kinase [Isoptericola cucumis]
MTEVFRKSRTDAPEGFFALEAAGLRWLEVPGGPRVARVVEVAGDHLDLEHVATTTPTPAAARDLGRRLAVLHDAGAPAFGALPPTADDPCRGYFGPLDDPLPTAAGSWDDWPSFYADARLRPVVEQGRERGVLTAHDAATVERVCVRLPALAGPAADEAPARLHGDLWSGNVLWSGASGSGVPGTGEVEAVLIDPAAHGGHREADLAMLALFGAPHLDELVAAYEAAALESGRPLAAGRPERTALHQLYPLAVHAVLFGGGYVDATRRLLASLARD